MWRRFQNIQTYYAAYSTRTLKIHTQQIIDHRQVYFESPETKCRAWLAMFSSKQI